MGVAWAVKCISSYSKNAKINVLAIDITAKLEVIKPGLDSVLDSRIHAN